MINARVVGSATSTVKHPSMEGFRLLVVQPYGPDAQTPEGDPLIAVDTMGAGKNDNVMITSDGRAAREVLSAENTPVRWIVIGICDH